MTTNKMKGVLKGLRYISQIFENEKEETGELQIGFPTDVKHVAHIGSDNSAGNPPTWMNGFQEPGGAGDPKNKSTSKDPSPRNSAELQLTAGPTSSENPTRKPKQSKRHNSSNGLDGSLSRDPSHGKPRRNKSSNLESSSRDAALSRPRRPKNSSIGSEQDGESASAAPKEKSQRRRSKDMGSRSGRGQDPLGENGSDTGEGRGQRSKTKDKNPRRREDENDNQNDDISREIGAML